MFAAQNVGLHHAQKTAHNEILTITHEKTRTRTPNPINTKQQTRYTSIIIN